MKPLSENLRKRIFIVAGSIALVIGIIGIIVPILPTTPFLLIAAFCYMKGSLPLYYSLVGNRFVGNYIKNYIEGKGMSLKVKIWTLGLLWTAIFVSIALGTDSLIIRIILSVVLIGVTIHILKIRTA